MRTGVLLPARELGGLRVQPSHECFKLVRREPLPGGLASRLRLAGHANRRDSVAVVCAAVTTAEPEMPTDRPLALALAYLTGRIAKEQVIALQHARNLVNAAHARAEHHWRAAIAAERRRVALESPTREPKRVESV